MTDRARDQARAQLDGIMELVAQARDAIETGNEDSIESALDDIHLTPLSREVRSGWTAPGYPLEALEYCILLCTGGPAVRILGTLNQYAEPTLATLEYQDWGTPWTEYVLTPAETDGIMEYARAFYFGT